MMRRKEATSHRRRSPVAAMATMTIVMALVFSPSVSDAAKDKKDAKTCASLGFVDPLCSTCDALSSALADLPSISSSSSSSSSSRLYAVVDEFNDDCRSCCTPDADADDGASAAAAADDADDDASSSSSSSSSTAAHSAILEVSRQTLRNFRHVEEFIKHKLKGFEGRVKVRDRFGARPRIFLLDGKGKRLNSEEPVRVDHWKTEDIESFLRERLVAVAEEKKNEKKEKKKKKGGGGGGGTSTAK